MSENNEIVLLEEYEILREDKKHNDRLIYNFLCFYFAIAPLFLLVGVECKEYFGYRPLIFCIIFDIILGFFTVEAILTHRNKWNYDIYKAKNLEGKIPIKHFSEFEFEIMKYSRFYFLILFMSLFLVSLVSIIAYLIFKIFPGIINTIIGSLPYFLYSMYSRSMPLTIAVTITLATLALAAFYIAREKRIKKKIRKKIGFEKKNEEEE